MGYHFRERESFVRIIELTPAMRKQIEDTIEHLLSMLDHFDGDENLEDGADDEPYLGWTGMQSSYSGVDACDDREAEDEHDEDGADSEPTLGAPERHPRSIEFAPFGVVISAAGPISRPRDKSQEHWADGLPGDHEREDENEHGGDVLDEPHDPETDYEGDYY